MATTLHLTFGFILFLSSFRAVRTSSGNDKRVPWYIGCYNNSAVAEDASFTHVSQDGQMTPVFCVRQCAFKETFKYAAIRNGSICSCLTQIPQNNSVNHTFCNVSCHGDTNVICGGANASSVYSTAVPLLFWLNISLPRGFKTNSSVTAYAELSIKRPGDEVSRLDRIMQGNLTANVILFKWSSGGKLWNKTQYTLQGNLMTTSMVFLFAKAGHHNVCVEAFNLFSHQKRCVMVGVVAPINGLKLVTVFQGSKKPSLSSPLLIANSKTAYFKFLTETGSRPKFRFDFGDGSSPLTVMDTASDRYSSVCSCVTVSHMFERCGNFTVNVTASNNVSLETVAQPVQVFNRFSVEKLEIKKKNVRDSCVFVEANVSSTLTAVLTQVQGCAVFRFAWKFNDSSPNVTTRVPSVSHTFSRSQSVYYVTVVAFNDHGRKEATQKVCLQERLQGLILKPQEESHVIPQMTLKTTDNVKLIAELSPPFTGRVRYFLHSNGFNEPRTGGPDFALNFINQPGRFFVFAKAENQVSQVVSNTIVISVFEKIMGLSIHSEGTVLLGKPILLTANVKRGTNVTFHWDFGDGLQNSTFHTTSRNVSYKFTKKGRYKISVTATNGLRDEEEEASIYIHVTDVPHCYPPEIRILGVENDEVNRSKEIRLEADVTQNCSDSRELVYLWKVTHVDQSKSVVVKPAGVSFTDQVLIIPPCVLDYGSHYFQLEVKVKDTGLLSENKIKLVVVKSPLVAIIKGGTTKVVSRKKQQLTMDASSSHDPDFPDEGHKIGFKWSCNPLGNQDISCFNESRALGINRNLSVLTFQLDWLVMLEDSSFLFTVTVSKDSRNFTALQILYVDTKESHLLSANCPQCEKGLINPSAPLVITGLCFSCPLDNTNITYKWQLFLVGDDEDEKWEKEEECPAGPTGSDQSNEMPNSDVGSTRKPMPTLQASQSQTTANNLVVGTTLQTPTNPPLNSETVKPTSAPRKHYVKFAIGRICRDPAQILGPMTRSPTRHSTRRPGSPASPGSGGGSGSGPGHGFGHGKGSGSGGGGGWGKGPGKATGSGTGSGSGGSVPNFGSGVKNKTVPTSSQQNFTTISPTTDDDGNEGDDKEIPDQKDPTPAPPPARHSVSIITLKSRKIKLSERQTTTGFRSQNFVLLGKSLKGGRTYMVSFTVTDSYTGQRGKATVYFNTSVIPECGVCAITPPLGVALETTFQLTCSKWTVVGGGALSYHVSYSIDDDSNKEEISIYSGYRSVVPFVLPAGLASSNHTVQVHVTVASGEGTKQRVQPLKVKVSSQTTTKGVTMEEVLLNETVGKYLSMLQETGNEQGVRQFITALANTLNRLDSVKNVSSRFYLRMQIRGKLLLLIRNLTVNDQNSALQTSLALQTLTTRPEELSERSVETASRILQHLGEVMQATQRSMRANRIEDRFLLSQEFVQAMMGVTSNLIEAASILIRSNARTPFNKQNAKDNVLLRATEAAEKLIKAKLSAKVLGEQPLLITTPYIRVNATQLTSLSNSLFSLGDIKFHMPVNLEKQLKTASVGKEGSCYGTMMTVYKENPFFSEMEHTKVGSLSLSNCKGEDIEVRNLSSPIHISIPPEKHKVERRTEEFVLAWNHENKHVINRTEKMMNQSLHVHVRVLSKLPPGFVFKLIVSTSKTDSFLETDLDYTVSSAGKAIDLYLGNHQLNASRSVSAKVLLEDMAFYRIKSIQKGPSIRYSLNVQWMGCFYWNKDVNVWTSDGCEVTDKSTDEMLFCSCNHLTAFSGAFVYPPNSLTVKDLTDAEKLKQAPVTLALVVSIIALYLVLLGFCIRADKHDKKKLGAVYISENITGGVSQRFQITVQTGHWFGAGTSANVFLILHGDDCVSDPIELKSIIGKPLFERSSCDVFVLSLPGKSFGNIRKIHVWHDNSGERPSWFLEHVIVKNVNNGLNWFFNCNRWLAVDEADGKVECEFQEKSDHPSGLKQCFSRHSSKSFLDYHLWFSLFGRPSYSRFSRAQRLTCCVSLLLSFLCVSIAWYRPKTEVPEVLGIIDVTAESIWIGVLCSIVALPVNLLWVFLFRYSRRSFRHHVKVFPISEPQTDTTELVSSSVLDQSLETVLLLKNIGERKRWFQTVWELDDLHSETCSCHSVETLGHASDSTSLGYNSGHGALSCSDPPLRSSHAGLLETCDFLAEISPGRKKSLEFEKRSTYSVSLSSTASEGRGAYRSRFSLPHVCVYVAWFGCVITAIVAAVFTVWYGVSFGWDLSIRWLQSLFFSLLESFLLSQPIMVVVFILYMAYKSNMKKQDEETDEGFEDLSSSALHEIRYGHLNQGFVEEDTSRDDEDDVDPALVLRRRQRYLKFLKPPSKSKLSEARSKCVQSKAMWNYTIELMVFILFLTVTCLLVTSVTCPDVYRLNQSIKKAFIRSENSEPGSVQEAWKEISSALYENSASFSHTPFTILLRDSQSLLFGRTRITQYKTDLLTACDEASGSGNGTFCHAQCHAIDGAWISVELNQTSDESAKQLKEITNSQWINACTREIAVEFAVYTPFLRAISAASLTVKASFTGKPNCQLALNTFPAFFESTQHGYFFRVCKLLFVALFLYILQHEFFLALKMSKKYFTSFWRLTQLLTVTISSLCVVLYIRWSVSLYALLREVETTTQTRVFYYAELVSWSQEALQAAYSLLLFLLIIRCVYLLRPFRSMVRLGKYFASIAHRILACMVMIAVFMMTFVHTGHLLFGRLHSAFKSFGETFLLVSGFFRLQGVNQYQGPAVEEHPVLLLLYFALFLIGFYVFMRGTTAAVFVYGIQRCKKRRHKLFADFMEDFIRSKLQSLREKTQRRERRDSTSGEEEYYEEDEDYEELEAYENDAPFPMEHVLDEVEDQLQELELRMDNLMGSQVFGDRYSSDDLLSFSDKDEDVEYLYQAEQTSPVSSTGYDSDHSNTSAAKWQFSSSSSHDLSDYYSSRPCGWRNFRDRSDWFGKYRPNRPVKSTSCGRDMNRLGLASSSLHDMDVYPSEEVLKLRDKGDPSCSSCYEMGRNNSGFTYYGEEELRDDDLRDGELRGGVLRDGVWHVGDLHDGVVYASMVRDGILRDEDIPVKTTLGGSFSSAVVRSQDLSSCSSHSLAKRPDPDKEPIRPKTMYGVTRTHARRGHEAAAQRPATVADGSSSDAAANSSSDQETGRKTKKSHPRRAKGLFRSSAVYPGQEGFALGPSPPLGESRGQAAWGLAPSASERGFQRTPDPHAKPAASERGFQRTPDLHAKPAASEGGPVRSPDPLDAEEDSELFSPAWIPDPHVPDTPEDAPVKGLLGDISMNKRLGTKITNDDSPEGSTPTRR